MLPRKEKVKSRLLAGAAVVALLFPSGAMAVVQPGDLVTHKNLDQVKGLISPGVENAVQLGMDLAIVPYRRIFAPRAFREATEQYSDQAFIDDNNDMKSWVAGTPFPVIDINDPKAAPKIMYNYERGFFYSDDLNLNLVDGETGTLNRVSDGHSEFNIEKHFVVDWARVLMFEGRLYHEPKPKITNNPDGVLRKFGYIPIIEPFDIKGVGSLNFRYTDRTRADDTWLYIPQIRRVRRLGAAQRSDALFGQDLDVDSFGGYAGQIPWFDWKLLGQRPMLGSIHGVNLPGKPCTRDGGMTYCENWELRPNVYVIEGTPKVEGYAYSKRVVYVDKEAWVILFSDLYDTGGELWKVLVQNIRTSTKPNPQADLEYDEEHLFVYGVSMIDLQIEHGSRFSIPGMAFPEAPGWYVDKGPTSQFAVSEDWFSVANLVSTGK